MPQCVIGHATMHVRSLRQQVLADFLMLQYSRIPEMLILLQSYVLPRQSLVLLHA